jgi:tripartite-type tricarboxylate transporter receptor subunit TctC
MIRNAVIAVLALAGALPALAQYPERPLNVIAGYPAGGSARRAKGRRAT